MSTSKDRLELNMTFIAPNSVLKTRNCGIAGSPLKSTKGGPWNRYKDTSIKSTSIS